LEYGIVGLGIFSFTESFINPVPISPIMAFAIVGAGLPAWPVFLVTVITNIAGSAVGFYLGEKLGHPVCIRLFGERKIMKAEKFFKKWGEFGVVLMAFTPLPFKVACWGAGIFEMRFWHFFIAAIIGRLAHFIVALGVVYYGWEAFSFFIQ